MASEAAAGEASTSEPAAKEKPIVVRVKRKPSQTRPDAFWLEINERPVKKAMLDLSSLSISEPSSSAAGAKASEEPRVRKILVQHIETVHHSEAVEDVLHSLLLADSNTQEIKSKRKEWNDRIKQDKKQDQLRSAARQQHEDLGRNARFAQIWRSRKGEKNEVDESLREICHLYDAAQVDPDEEKHPAEPRIISFEEGAVLCNFLPLIREYLPSAAEEIESDIISLASSEGYKWLMMKMNATMMTIHMIQMIQMPKIIQYSIILKSCRRVKVMVETVRILLGTWKVLIRITRRKK
ncbi:RNA-directed DNA methylation 4-like isoform X2 [Phragmites australis]|uniref:RNA-directed DNA methylation 4-like isoform X2 n=1 Tax=Phragmites australis TaxID=29695 RepID=UPI002D797D92|nr:RNA-directed DNA methylation 4-like isoform X2 [Phragmites australis]